MDVAVAGMEHVHDADVVLLADFADAGQDVRQFRAGDHAVLGAKARAEPADRAERLFAGLPELQPLLGVLGEADFAGAVLAADVGHAVALDVKAGFEAIDFDQQHRLRVEREAEVKRRFHGDDNAMIHHLQRGRDDPRADDSADRVRRRVDRLEHAEHRADALRIAREPDPDSRHDRQRPLAADDRADQVEARRIFGGAAEPDYFPFGGDDFQTEHVVDGDAVLERVRAAGVCAHVAADGAGALAGRVRGIVKTGAGQVTIERPIDDARLDHGVAIAKVDLVDRLHPREHDHHAAADRRAAAREAGPRPTRHERHAGGHAPLHDLGDFGRRLREHGHLRPVLLQHEGVALVNQQLGLCIEDVLRAHDPAQGVHESSLIAEGGHRHRARIAKSGSWETPIIGDLPPRATARMNRTYAPPPADHPIACGLAPTHMPGGEKTRATCPCSGGGREVGQAARRREENREGSARLRRRFQRHRRQTL